MVVFLFFRIFGPPKTVQHDGGGEFKAAFAQYLNRLGIEDICSSPYHPESQGKDERSHRTWKEKMKHDMLNQRGNLYDFTFKTMALELLELLELLE